MQVSAQYAREHFDELLDSADQGESVEITREGKPPVRLFLVNPAATTPAKKRILGAGEGQMKVPSYEEWKAMDKEIEDLMLADTLDLSCIR